MSTSAEIAERILDFEGPVRPSSKRALDETTLSELIQLHHDAVVAECADLLVRAAKRATKTERATLLAAVEEIRALRGCV